MKDWLSLRMAWMAAVIATAIFLLLSLPDANGLIINRDMGNQLSKGWMITQGIHPYIDYANSIYGPLVFYTSATVMWLADDTLIGEVALVLAGWMAAYLLFFALCLKLVPYRMLALMWLGIALVIMPVFYKYYILLAPMLVATAMFFYSHACIQRPYTVTGLLALAMVIAGLYRIDAGAYACASIGVLMLLLHHRQPARLVKHGVLFAGTGLLLVLPYLIFALVKSGNATGLLWQFIDTARGTSSGLALEAPQWQFASGIFTRQNSFALFYRTGLVLPWVTAAFALWSLRRADAEQRMPYARVIALSVLAALFFIQATHRSDISHWQQAFIPQLLLMAWLLDALAQRCRHARPMMFIAPLLVAVLVLPLHSRSLATVKHHLRQPSALAYTLDSLTWPLPTLLERLSQQDNDAGELARIARTVRQHTDTGEAVLFLPYQPQMYFFSQRHFATEYGWLHPGRFATEAQQNTFADSMLDNAAMVVVWRQHCFDGMPERCFNHYGKHIVHMLEKQMTPVVHPDEESIGIYINHNAHTQRKWEP